MKPRAITAVCAFTLTCVLALPALAQQTPASGPGSGLGGYRAQSAGAVMSIRPVFPALLPTGDAPAEVTIALSTSNVGSGGNSYGQSSIIYPGSAAANLGPLLGQLADPSIAGLLPPYPLAVQASAKDGEIIKGAPPAVVMRANGREDRGEGETRLADVGAPGIVEIDNVTTVSRSLVNAGDVGSRTEVVLQGVQLIGGAIKIGSIRTLVEASSNGRAATVVGRTEVTGVKVGEFDAALGFDGLHVTGAPGGAVAPAELPALDEQLNAILSTLGAELKLTRVASGSSAGAGDVVAQGVLLKIENPFGNLVIPGSGLPAIPPGRVEILLASASAASQASPPFSASLPGVEPSDTDTDFDSPGTGSLVGADGAIGSGPVIPSGLPTAPGGAITATGERIDYGFDGLGLGLVLLLALLTLVGAWYVRAFVLRIVTVGE